MASRKFTRESLQHFEQTRRAHAATHAHRDHDVAHAAALALDERMAHQPRTGHAVRMPDGNCATIDVEAFLGNTEALAAVDHLHGEGLVEFPQADVIDAQPEALQQPRYRGHRADAHFIGPRTGDRHADIATEWFDAAL